MLRLFTWLRELQFPKAVMTRKNPVIFVIGCTGSGKSDLGVAIAKKYDGEIISADSMQIYKGLDIATNKITKEEADGIPHHLMSFVDAATARYNIHQFRAEGLKVIEEIKSRGRIPVVVGGTAYYVESLLFEENIIETPGSENVAEIQSLNKLSNAELHQKLVEVDPESARLIHPNNRNRVLRAIEVYNVTGKRKSEFLREQKESNGSCDLGGHLRFHESLVLSLDAAKEVLAERLDRRVEKMKQMGLRKELEDYYDENRDKLINRDHFGVLQCIGLKEFIPYLELPKEERSSPKGDMLFEKGCDDVKLHTRQYARRQRNWVNSRFVRRQEAREVPSLKKLDTSNKDTFLASGLNIVEKWMSGCDFKEEVNGEAENSEDANMIRYCEVCEILVSGTRSWNKHLAGKRHKNAVRAAKRRRELTDGSVTSTGVPGEDVSPSSESESKKKCQEV
uniref:tRNA dimethylallyltransferase n=1 Tax=Haemonchus contortus TaxID=6289 RepID=A0A7I4YCN9_HAECO